MTCGSCFFEKCFFEKHHSKWVQLYLFFTQKSSGKWGKKVILKAMDQTALLVTLFFTLILGAGIGFYVAQFIF